MTVVNGRQSAGIFLSVGDCGVAPEAAATAPRIAPAEAPSPRSASNDPIRQQSFLSPVARSSGTPGSREPGGSTRRAGSSCRTCPAPPAPSGAAGSAWPGPPARRGRNTPPPGRGWRPSGAIARGPGAGRRSPRPAAGALARHRRRPCPGRSRSSAARHPGSRRRAAPESRPAKCRLAAYARTHAASVAPGSRRCSQNNVQGNGVGWAYKIRRRSLHISSREVRKIRRSPRSATDFPSSSRRERSSPPIDSAARRHRSHPVVRPHHRMSPRNSAAPDISDSERSPPFSGTQGSLALQPPAHVCH